MKYAGVLVVVASVAVLGGCQTSVTRSGSSGMRSSATAGPASSAAASSSGTGGASTTAAGTTGSSTGGATSSGGTAGAAIPVTTLAGGGGITCFDGDGGFDGVLDIRLGPSGNVYVLSADQAYEIASDGTISGVFAQNILPNMIMSDIAIGSTGAFFVSAYAPDLFSQVYQLGGSTATLLAGNGGVACGDTGSDAGVGFGAIGGMVLDTSGDLLVTQRTVAPNQEACDSIRRIAPDGTTTTVAGSGVPGFANGSASQAQFGTPRGIVIDGHGNLLIADSGNNRIRKIAPDGTTSTLAGNGAASFQDGSGAGAAFDDPLGLAIDGQDNLYVGDARNARIRKVTPQGETSTVAGNGMIGFVDGTLGPDGTTEFATAGRVAINAAGTALYVADEGNCAVRVIALPAP